MQKTIRPALFITMTLAAICAAIALSWALSARANPSSLVMSNGTLGSLATTTPVFATAGTATTTEIMDMAPNGGSVADSALFLLQQTGSTTAGKTQVNFEYAQTNTLDCFNAQTSCDWYTFYSTTTLALGNRPGGVGNGVSSTTLWALPVANPVQARYIRATVTIPLGSVNGAFWGRFVAKKQVN